MKTGKPAIHAEQMMLAPLAEPARHKFYLNSVQSPSSACAEVILNFIKAGIMRIARRLFSDIKVFMKMIPMDSDI